MTNPDSPQLPHSLDLERVALNAELERNRPAPGLAPCHFFRHAHAVTKTACDDAAARGHSREYPIVRQILIEQGRLDAVGAVYLNDLAKDGVALSDAALLSIADKLRELHRKREALAVLSKHAADPLSIDIAQIVTDLEGIEGSARARSPFQTAKSLAVAAQAVDWIVRGYVARGAITELTGKPKIAGKTTLFAYWVACLLDGDLCFGAMAQQTPVVYLTEQPPATFREPLRRAGLLEREDLSVLSFWDVKGTPWPAIAKMAGHEAERIGAKVIIVDTFGQFAGIKGDAENNSGDAQEALAPVQWLAHQGYALLLSRHARKSGGDVGEDGRGSSAFTGGVDIVLSLKRPEGKHRPTMRLLEALSRYDETPAKLVFEKVSGFCSALGKEVRTESFQVLGDSEAVATDEARAALERYLPSTETDAATVDHLVSLTRADKSTLKRALSHLPGVQTIGKGKKGDPLRYFRPESVSVQTSNPQVSA